MPLSSIYPPLYRLARFGKGTRLYTFPQATTFDHNFANLVPRVARLPGTDGGFDEFNDEPAPSEVGTVSASWYIVPQKGESITTLLDNVRAMADWGKQRLYVQPYDRTLGERWANVRINSIQGAENAKNHPHLWQEVKVTWQAGDDPFWYAQGTEAPLYGEAIYGALGAVYGGSSPVIINAAGVLTSSTITVSGNATTLAYLSITVPATKSAQNLTIQRLDGGVIRDEVKWTGTLTPSDTLIINPRTNSVTLNSADAYTTSFSRHHPDFFRLRPGANDLRVLMNNNTDQATIRVRYYERYR